MNTNDKGNATSKTVFFVGKEKFTVDVSELSVEKILSEYAKEDPAKVTLALKEGNTQTKLTDLTQIIPLKDGMKFVIFHNEPTPVS